MRDLMEAADEEYDDLVATQKKSDIIFKRNQYRLQEVKCCDTCHHSTNDYGEDYQCRLALVSDNWNTGSVSRMGICKMYRRR